MSPRSLRLFLSVLLTVGGILAFAPSAFSAELRGQVLTPEGKAVSEAVVLDRSSGRQVLTGEDGTFVLSVETAGKVRLEVLHPDYLEERLTVPEGWGAKTLSIVLVPLIRQREEIVVTALRYPEPTMNIPAAGTVLTGETLSEGLAPNLTKGVESVPGVAPLGSGGFSLVPTIRGLTRNRVLFLVDLARVSSDRRTGPNASFLSPEDIERIEILRSPSSVFYGSDALGGVFQAFLKGPDPRPGFHGRLNARYGSVNGEKGGGLSLSGRRGDFGFYLSAQGVDAGNYRNAEGIVPQSAYSQWSLTAKAVYQTDRREIDLSVVRSRGLGIGKPARDSLTRPTWYPRENHNLVQLHWREKDFGGGELILGAFLNPNFLETRTDRWSTYKTRESYARTESTDFGFQLSFHRPLAPLLRLNAGIDLTGRLKTNAHNRDVNFNSQGETTSTFEETPYANGLRTDLGGFVSLDLAAVKRLDLVGGIRWDRILMEAEPGGAGVVSHRVDSAFSGFLAASFRFTKELTGFANVSRAYRAPTLGERFYTGITGRGFIISRPDLESERSWNVDSGLKVAGTRFFAAVYAFRYEIEGLIDRVLVAPQLYTYANVDRGRIVGGEAEGEWFPLERFKLFGSLSLARGRSVRTSQPLNDIPPIRLQAGVRLWIGRFSGEATVRHQTAKTDPGQAEISLPACTWVDLRVNGSLSPSWRFQATVQNVFDVLVLGRPDPDAPYDPGRNISLGLVYSF